MSSHDQDQTSITYDSPAKNEGSGDSGSPEQTPHVYEFGDFRLNTRDKTKFRLLLNGQPHKIQDMPFRLLCALVESRGEELSNGELIKYLWPGAAVDDINRAAYVGRLHHHVKTLRRTIGWDMVASRKGGGAYYLTSPVRPMLEPVIPEPAIPDLEFQQWIIRSGESRGIKIFLGAGVTLSIIYSVAYLLDQFNGYPPLAGGDPVGMLSLIQLGVVSGALVASILVFDRNIKEFPGLPQADAELMRISGYTDREKWGRAKEGARNSRKQFSGYWKLLLVAWVCLYLMLTLSAYFKGLDNPLTEEKEYSDILRVLTVAKTFFNNCNSWAIALCFIVFNYPTVIRARAKGTDDARQRGADVEEERGGENEQETNLARLIRLTNVWGLGVIITFAAVEYLFISPLSAQWFPSLNPERVIWWTDLSSGIVGAVTLALFVGRIQSKFLGPSTWLPSAFFFYVAIQSLYVAVGNERWASAVIEAALILKCIMYLYVAWLFKSGRLLFYLVRVKRVYESVNIDWRKFLTYLNKKQ